MLWAVRRVALGVTQAVSQKEGALGYLERYVAEETAGEYKAGRISYRELLRRLTMLTGSALAAVALAATLGCTADSTPTPINTIPAPTATAAPTPTATVVPFPTATPVPTATATPVPAPTATPAPPATFAPGITVSPSDPAIEAGNVTFQNAGVTLMGYLARPKAGGTYPAVLVIHENQGLVQPHFPDVARRFAKEGYVALALDLLSREGGTASLSNPAQASALLGRAGEARLVEDMNGAVRYLQGLPSVRPDRVGAVGFCAGGGMVWLLSVRNPDIKAAVPFYGPRPPLNEVPNIRAAVLGLYGATDTFINSGVPDLEAALRASNKTFKTITYPNAPHAFFNDTGSFYRPPAPEAAWKDTLAWFAQYLKG